MSAEEQGQQENPGLFADLQSEPVRHAMLGLARRALMASAQGKPLESPEPTALPPCLLEQGACFITLRKGPDLRGCIGNIIARDPLYAAIIQNTQGAALRDSRFPPVSPEEAPMCSIGISVLTPPEDLLFSDAEELLMKLRPHEHGVVLRIADRMSTFLPQVWEVIPKKGQFMEQLSRKAGFHGQAWREPGARVQTYRAIKVVEEG